MCGICGKLNLDLREPVSPALVKSMADTIAHRGPDDEGYYVSGPVGFGFRRLSIIDLAAGHQPLSNEDGTVWIVFNGEIYNYRELRAFLVGRGHVFKTNTDTEVIVHLYEELGPRCVEKLRGMFGFAIWDAKAKTLFLARDRVGIKPLYYCFSENTLLFGSEVKAILADPSVSTDIVPEVIDRFLTFLYLPGTETLFRGIQKLAPGHYMMVRDGKPVIEQYWDLQFPEPSGKQRLQDAEAQLESLLAETVKLHMISDVPVGILLSGGVDSSGVLSLAVQATNKKISTFTVGFDGEGVADERPYAKLAAKKFGVEHFDMTISAQDFADFLPQYAWHMEEPVCEPPAIALYYVSQLARKHATVLLSGEGGDEAFAGYTNYRNLVWLERIKRGLSFLNPAVSQGLSLANSLLHSPQVAEYASLMNERFPDYYYSRSSNPHRYAGNGLSRIYSEEFASGIDRQRTLQPLRDLQERTRDKSTLNAMLYIDTKTWLPDDLLVKADKMTMANSIELRVPLLDHKVLEFAASLPDRFKLNGFTTKYLLKKVLSRSIPREIIERKKTGFPVPYESWIRKDLKNFVWDVLTDSKTTNRAFFRKDAIEQLLRANAANGSHGKEIFSLLSLELWQRAFLVRETVAA